MIDPIDAPERDGGQTMIIEGVDRYRVCEAMFEGIRVVLSHRGERFSPAYIQGISGMAFRIGGICPCAPTCNPVPRAPEEFVKFTGYAVERLPFVDGQDPEAQARRIGSRVKDEIRAGRLAIVWNAFTTAEFDVVAGFDDAEDCFWGRGSYAGMDGYAKAPQNRMKEFGPALGAILIGDKTGTFDARSAEVEALKEAVQYAHSQRNVEQAKAEPAKWHFLDGLACYQRWVQDWRDPAKQRGPGDSYCYGIYRSTHRAAGQFLLEIAPRYPRAAAMLEEGARHFAAEADILDAGQRLMWWDAPQAPDEAGRLAIVEMLSSAGRAYGMAIGAMGRALDRLG